MDYDLMTKIKMKWDALGDTVQVRVIAVSVIIVIIIIAVIVQ